MGTESRYSLYADAKADDGVYETALEPKSKWEPITGFRDTQIVGLGSQFSLGPDADSDDGVSGTAID